MQVTRKLGRDVKVGDTIRTSTPIDVVVSL